MIQYLMNLFGLSSIQLYVVAGLVGAILLMAVGGFFYFKWSQSEIRDLAVKYEQQKEAVATLNLAVRQKQADIDNIQAANKRLANARAKDAEALDNLEIKLNAAKLGLLGQSDPESAKAKINKGIAFRNRCLEIASGGKIGLDEVNVPITERNTICPQYFGYPQ